MTAYNAFILKRDKLFEETFGIRPEQIVNHAVSITFPENDTFVDCSFSLTVNGEIFQNVVKDCGDNGTIRYNYGEFLLPFQNNLAELNLYKNKKIISDKIPLWRLEVKYELCNNLVELTPQVVICNYNDDKDRDPDDCYEFIIPVEVKFLF